MGLMTNEAILRLAERVAPIVRPIIYERGQLSPADIRNALKRIGRPTVTSDRTIHMIDTYITEGCNQAALNEELN